MTDKILHSSIILVNYQQKTLENKQNYHWRCINKQINYKTLKVNNRISFIFIVIVIIRANFVPKDITLIGKI